MDSACVYEDKTVIHELTQGLQMAQQLRAHLRSPEARDFYIQMILLSYDKALCVLRSGHSAGQLPSLPESSISFGSTESEEFQFDQHFSGQHGEKILPRKRKGSTTLEDQGCRKHTYNLGAQSASPPSPSPHSPEKHEIMPTHHQLSAPSPGEVLSNLRTNLSVNTSDMGGESDNIPSSFSFPSTSPGLMEDNHQLHFPNYYDDELLPIFSPPFISPVTSGSNIFTDWGSSQSLDCLADVDLDFELEYSN